MRAGNGAAGSLPRLRCSAPSGARLTTTMANTWVFIQARKRPSTDLLGAVEIVHHARDLLVLLWLREFSDLSNAEETAEELWVTLGADLLRLQRDDRGILLAPAASAPISARDYESAVMAYAADGIWLENIAREPGGFLVAGDEAEIPLPRFPNSRRLEFYVVNAARAVKELKLSAAPLRTVRLELVTNAAPREVSAFYLPLMRALGLAVKRRTKSNAAAELLIGQSRTAAAFVRAANHGPAETLIQISWVELA